MKNYFKINSGQSYETIAQEVARQIGGRATEEILYQRIPGTKNMYSAHALNNNCFSPRLKNADFVGAGLYDKLNRFLEGDLILAAKLPKQIRVIRPTQDIQWGVFFCK